MKFYGNMIKGILAILGAGLLSIVIWFLFSSGFYIDQEVTLPIANTFEGLCFVPAIIFYILWYRRITKAKPEDRANKKWKNLTGLFAGMASGVTLLFLFIPALIFGYISTVVFLVLTVVLVTGAFILATMVIGKPMV